MFRAITIAAIIWLIPTAVFAGEPFEGLNLVSPNVVTESYLMDMDGVVLKTWHGEGRIASMAYMLADSSILRPSVDREGQFAGGGAGGHIQRIDADDAVVWDYYFSSSQYQQHHDIQPMPGGTVLLIAWELKTREEAQAWGRREIYSDMWPTLIVEVEPVGLDSGTVVWEWHAWDHLVQDIDPGLPNYGVVSEHPELLDINYGSVGPGGGDWLHVNAIDYNSDLDQIVFSSKPMNEFYVIDHSTTTEEAAGHNGGNTGMGGDILYRWGNPQVYDRGDDTDRRYDTVHGANWIDEGLPGAGNILTFNNGDRPGSINDYSSVLEIVPPVDEFGNYAIMPDSAFGPAEPIWTHGESATFYGGPAQCGAFRMPNGNTLISLSPQGVIFEVTEAGSTVWYYTYGLNVPRSMRYWDDCGSVEGDLMQGALLRSVSAQPIPFRCSARIGFELSEAAHVEVEVFDVAGRLLADLAGGSFGAGGHQLSWSGRSDQGLAMPAGVYFVRVKAGGDAVIQKTVLAR